MEIRSGAMPDDGQADRPAAAAPAPEEPPVAPSEIEFSVDRRLTAVRIGGAVVFVLFALLFGSDPVTVSICGLAAAVLAAYAVRDVFAPHRLAADAAGLTVVTGYLGRRRLSWDQIERVRLDERRRLGLRSELLEIDAGDELHLLSGYDLGVPVHDAARALAALALAGQARTPGTDH